MEHILRDEYVNRGLLETYSINRRTQVAVCLVHISDDSAVVASVFLHSEGIAVCWDPRHTGFVLIVPVTRFGELCFF